MQKLSSQSKARAYMFANQRLCLCKSNTTINTYWCGMEKKHPTLCIKHTSICQKNKQIRVKSTNEFKKLNLYKLKIVTLTHKLGPKGIEKVIGKDDGEERSLGFIYIISFSFWDILSKRCKNFLIKMPWKFRPIFP